MTERMIRTGHIVPDSLAYLPKVELDPVYRTRRGADLADLYFHYYGLNPETDSLSLAQFKEASKSFTLSRMCSFWYLQDRKSGLVGLWQDEKKERFNYLLHDNGIMKRDPWVEAEQ